MRAGYMPAVGVAEFRDDMPEPQIEKADDVKIRVRNCGICGSEVHAIHGLHPFRIPPIVSGHEVAGDVVAVGEGVTKFKVGDRVKITGTYYATGQRIPTWVKETTHTVYQLKSDRA